MANYKPKAKSHFRSAQQYWLFLWRFVMPFESNSYSSAILVCRCSWPQQCAKRRCTERRCKFASDRNTIQQANSTQKTTLFSNPKLESLIEISESYLKPTPTIHKLNWNLSEIMLHPTNCEAFLLQIVHKSMKCVAYLWTILVNLGFFCCDFPKMSMF